MYSARSHPRRSSAVTEQLRQIALDFESALLAGVRSGAGEADLNNLRDQAFDRLLAVKEGPTPPCLESFFDVAGEIGLKLNMALETIRRVDAERRRP